MKDVSAQVVEGAVVLIGEEHEGQTRLREVPKGEVDAPGRSSVAG